VTDCEPLVVVLLSFVIASLSFVVGVRRESTATCPRYTI